MNRTPKIQDFKQIDHVFSVGPKMNTRPIVMALLLAAGTFSVTGCMPNTGMPEGSQEAVGTVTCYEHGKIILEDTFVDEPGKRAYMREGGLMYWSAKDGAKVNVTGTCVSRKPPRF
jgi:hypothetical protein